MLTSPICCDRYDFLVVAPGLKINFDAVKGLREGLDNPNGPVSSIYSVDSCEKTWKNIQNFKEGRAVSFCCPETDSSFLVCEQSRPRTGHFVAGLLTLPRPRCCRSLLSRPASSSVPVLRRRYVSRSRVPRR